MLQGASMTRKIIPTIAVCFIFTFASFLPANEYDDKKNIPMGIIYLPRDDSPSSDKILFPTFNPSQSSSHLNFIAQQCAAQKIHLNHQYRSSHGVPYDFLYQSNGLYANNARCVTSWLLTQRYLTERQSCAIWGELCQKYKINKQEASYGFCAIEEKFDYQRQHGNEHNSIDASCQISANYKTDLQEYGVTYHELWLKPDGLYHQDSKSVVFWIIQNQKLKHAQAHAIWEGYCDKRSCIAGAWIKDSGYQEIDKEFKKRKNQEEVQRKARQEKSRQERQQQEKDKKDCELKVAQQKKQDALVKKITSDYQQLDQLSDDTSDQWQEIWQGREQALLATEHNHCAKSLKSYAFDQQTMGYCMHQQIDYHVYEQFDGTQLQHQFHQEMCQIFKDAAQLQWSLPCQRPLVYVATQCAQLSHFYNQEQSTFETGGLLIIGKGCITLEILVGGLSKTALRSVIGLFHVLNGIAHTLQASTCALFDTYIAQTSSDMMGVIAQRADRFLDQDDQHYRLIQQAKKDMDEQALQCCEKIVATMHSIGVSIQQLLDGMLLNVTADATKVLAQRAQRSITDPEKVANILLTHQYIAQRQAQNPLSIEYQKQQFLALAPEEKVATVGKLFADFFVTPELYAAGIAKMYEAGATIASSINDFKNFPSEEILIQAENVALAISQEAAVAQEVSIQEQLSEEIINGMQTFFQVANNTPVPTGPPPIPTTVQEVRELFANSEYVIHTKDGEILLSPQAPFFEEVKKQIRKILNKEAKTIQKEIDLGCYTEYVQQDIVWHNVSRPCEMETTHAIKTQIEMVMYDSKGCIPKYTGGHFAGTCQRLEDAGLVKILGKRSLGNGVIEYKLQCTFSKVTYLKTEFAPSWTIPDIFKAGWQAARYGAENITIDGVIFNHLQVHGVDISAAFRIDRDGLLHIKVFPYILQEKL